MNHFLQLRTTNPKEKYVYVDPFSVSHIISLGEDSDGISTCALHFKSNSSSLILPISALEAMGKLNNMMENIEEEEAHQMQ